MYKEYILVPLHARHISTRDCVLFYNYLNKYDDAKALLAVIFSVQVGSWGLYSCPTLCGQTGALCFTVSSPNLVTGTWDVLLSLRPDVNPEGNHLGRTISGKRNPAFM